LTTLSGSSSMTSTSSAKIPWRPTRRDTPPHQIKEGYAYPSACNSGLRYARGRLVYFMNDYVQVSPDTLQRHWDIYEKWGPSALICGVFQALLGMKQYPQRRPDRVVDDHLGEIIYFRKPDVIKLANGEHLMAPPSAPHWSAGVNDSAPLKLLLETNGFDERLDGSHGGSDDELGMRMIRKGARLFLDYLVPCYEHPHGPSKPSLGRPVEWYDLFAEAFDGRTWAPNPFDLGKQRAKVVAP
jgi:hypothetical protein